MARPCRSASVHVPRWQHLDEPGWRGLSRSQTQGCPTARCQSARFDRRHRQQRTHNQVGKGLSWRRESSQTSQSCNPGSLRLHRGPDATGWHASVSKSGRCAGETLVCKSPARCRAPTEGHNPRGPLTCLSQRFTKPEFSSGWTCGLWPDLKGSPSCVAITACLGYSTSSLHLRFRRVRDSSRPWLEQGTEIQKFGHLDLLFKMNLKAFAQDWDGGRFSGIQDTQTNSFEFHAFSATGIPGQYQRERSDS